MVKQNVIKLANVLFLLLLAELSYAWYRNIPEATLLNAFGFFVSIAIYVAIIIYWMMSLYHRIMQSHVRIYLMVLGSSMLFWVIIRSVKWRAFIYLVIEDRFVRYLYYVPMIVIALMSLYIALCVNEDEDYRINKKWYLLLIPATLLLLLILTNDYHELSFTLLYERNIMQDYGYNIVYYCTVVYILVLIGLMISTLIRKFKQLAKAKKAPKLPSAILLLGFVYMVVYTIDSSWTKYFLDMTLFTCVVCILFWESCIQTKLIHSNMNHYGFFTTSDLGAHILTSEGRFVYSSNNAVPREDISFHQLKDHRTIERDQNKLHHMKDIIGGYVIWSSDITAIKVMIEELEILQNNLYKEIELLEKQNKEQERSLKVEKQNRLYDGILKETRLHYDRIHDIIEAGKSAPLEERRRTLIEIALISVFIKRKTNLLLMAERGEGLIAEEMVRFFHEAFQVLRILNIDCTFHTVDKIKINVNQGILIYDFFIEVMEKTSLKSKAVLITYRVEGDRSHFVIQTAGKDHDDLGALSQFKEEQLRKMGAIITVDKGEEGYYIALNYPYV